MQLSCKSEYALLSLLELATQYKDGEPLQIRQIASRQNIPDRYLEQLLASLRRYGLIRSQRGARGGYLLAREPWKISLLEIVECIEGPNSQVSETVRVTETLERAIICQVWQEATQSAKSVLRNYTLQELCERREAQQQLNIMYYI